MACAAVLVGDFQMQDRRAYLTVAQVAEMFNLSEDKVLADIRKGALRAYTFNGTIRVRENDALGYEQPYVPGSTGLQSTL